jgi:hypothetical protein
VSILDLQGLGWKEENDSSGNSHGSHDCGNTVGGSTRNSTLSVACHLL